MGLLTDILGSSGGPQLVNDQQPGPYRMGYGSPTAPDLQQPGNGFMGGITGTGGSFGNQSIGGGIGQGLGAILRQLLGRSIGGSLGLFGLDQLLGNGGQGYPLMQNALHIAPQAPISQGTHAFSLGNFLQSYLGGGMGGGS